MLDWRDLTGKFYSKPEDVHETMSLGDEPKRTIPFVAVGFNSKLWIFAQVSSTNNLQLLPCSPLEMKKVEFGSWNQLRMESLDSINLLSLSGFIPTPSST